MIDSKILKENPYMIKELLKKRNMEFPMDDLFNLIKQTTVNYRITKFISQKKYNCQGNSH